MGRLVHDTARIRHRTPDRQCHPNCRVAHAARNYMHSILLVIPKPEQSKPGTEQAWESAVLGLQQQAAQAKGVITLYESCWLIPTEENGLLFFNYAIIVADSAKLHCRICLLSRPHNGFVHRRPTPGRSVQAQQPDALSKEQSDFGPEASSLLPARSNCAWQQRIITNQN